MAVSSERERVANTQDEGLEHGTDIRPVHHRLHDPKRACLTAPGQISQQLLEEAFQREEARKEELHLLEVEERRARITRLVTAEPSQIPPAQDIPRGRQPAKRKRSQSPSDEEGKSLYLKPGRYAYLCS
jgi:hypothetical protein